MIISDEEVERRLNSPSNLMNKLRSKTSINPARKGMMELFTKRKQLENELESKQSEPSGYLDISARIDTDINRDTDRNKSQIDGRVDIPTETPTTLDSLIQNHEAQIKLGLAHDKSLDLLTRSVNMLSEKLDDVNASRLPSVVMAASKVVESIRKERLESRKTDKDREVHYHFYTPQQKKVEDYTVIDVT